MLLSTDLHRNRVSSLLTNSDPNSDPVRLFLRGVAVVVLLTGCFILSLMGAVAHARTRTTQADIGVVVAVDRNLQDRNGSGWYSPGKVTGGIVAGGLARRIARNSRSRSDIVAIVAALGTAAGEAYDRREVRGWMTVVRYPDGRVAEVETARQPNVRVGDSVYVASNGALIRAPAFVDGDARPSVQFARDSGGR